MHDGNSAVFIAAPCTVLLLSCSCALLDADFSSHACFVVSVISNLAEA